MCRPSVARVTRHRTSWRLIAEAIERWVIEPAPFRTTGYSNTSPAVGLSRDGFVSVRRGRYALTAASTTGAIRTCASAHHF